MTEKTTKVAWTDESVATLQSMVSSAGQVSADQVEQAAEALGRSTRSISSKLRQLGYDVASLAKEKVAAFSADETAALVAFVERNAGAYTYKEIAEQFEGGKFNAKQVQGKLLALELTGSVKPAEKMEVAGKYTADEEAQFISMANAGAFIEDIAAKMGKELNSVRGKALSLVRKELITKIPAQRESHATAHTDPVDTLGDKITTMTVDEIAAAVDKTPRGIRTMLTRRGIDCADYKGSVKKEKAEGKKVTA